MNWSNELIERWQKAYVAANARPAPRITYESKWFTIHYPNGNAEAGRGAYMKADRKKMIRMIETLEAMRKEAA